MSAIISNSAELVAWNTETNYAGGAAGAKYSCTSPGNAGSGFTSFDIPSEDLTLGSQEYVREEMHPVGTGFDGKVVQVKGLKYGECTITTYVQTADKWHDYICIANASLAALTSYTIHYEVVENGAKVAWELFGCVPISYKFGSAGEEFPTQTITFIFYKKVAGTVFTTNIPTFPTTAMARPTSPKLFIDAATIGTPAAGDEYTTWLSMTLTVTLTRHDKINNAKIYRHDPYLRHRDFLFEVEFNLDVKGLLQEAIGDTLTEHKFCLWTGKDYITIDKMIVKSEPSQGGMKKEVDVPSNKVQLVPNTGYAVTTSFTLP